MVVSVVKYTRMIVIICLFDSVVGGWVNRSVQIVWLETRFGLFFYSTQSDSK